MIAHLPPPLKFPFIWLGLRIHAGVYVGAHLKVRTIRSSCKNIHNLMRASLVVLTSLCCNLRSSRFFQVAAGGPPERGGGCILKPPSPTAANSLRTSEFSYALSVCCRMLSFTVVTYLISPPHPHPGESKLQTIKPTAWVLRWAGEKILSF